MLCKYCNHEWDYQGVSTNYVCCPKCHYKLFFKREINTNWYMYYKRIIKKRYIPCQFCNKLKAKEVHHIDLNHHSNSDPQNFKLLCHSCHKVVHGRKRKTAFANRFMNKLECRICLRKNGVYYSSNFKETLCSDCVRAMSLGDTSVISVYHSLRTNKSL